MRTRSQKSAAQSGAPLDFPRILPLVASALETPEDLVRLSRVCREFHSSITELGYHELFTGVAAKRRSPVAMLFSRGVLMLEWPERRLCVPPLEPYVSWTESKEWARSEDEYWSTMAGFLPADKLSTLLQDLRGDRVLAVLDEATFEQELATQDESMPEFLKGESALRFIPDRFKPGQPPVSVRSELLGQDDGMMNLGCAFVGVGDWADPLSPQGKPEKIAAAVRLLRSTRRFPGLPPKVVRRGNPRHPAVGWTVPFLIGKRRFFFACGFLNHDFFGTFQTQMIIMDGRRQFAAHSQAMGTFFSKSFVEDITKAYSLQPLSLAEISGVLFCAIMQMSLCDPRVKGIPRWFYSLQSEQALIFHCWQMMSFHGQPASVGLSVFTSDECDRDWFLLVVSLRFLFAEGEIEMLLKGKLGKSVDSVDIGVLEEDWDSADDSEDDTEEDDGYGEDEYDEQEEGWEDDDDSEGGAWGDEEDDLMVHV